VRHHYSVTTTGLPELVDEQFHTFAEADARFTSLADRAQEAGMTPAGDSYWRRQFSVPGTGSARVALDDVGLVPCGPACGAG
jgi:hypothetical protein